MSLLRSGERLLEGAIGDVLVEPLIGYSVSLYELLLLDPSVVQVVGDFLPPLEVDEDRLGRVSVAGLFDEGLGANDMYLSSFLRDELLKSWGLPKKISIKMFEADPLEMFVLRPRVIRNHLVVEEVEPLEVDYCKDVYSLGLGEDRTVRGIHYWSCTWIEVLKVYNRYDITEGWVNWVSY